MSLSLKKFKDFINENFPQQYSQDGRVIEPHTFTINPVGEDVDEYMFFQNLINMKDQIEEILKMNPDKVDELLRDGHAWAVDHMATAKEDVEQVYSFLKARVNESVNEAKANVTQFTKPGNDGDIYFSKREGNAIAVRDGDKLQSIYVYNGEVKLGKIHKTDKRWDNMGAPSEKLLVDLSLQNVGGLNTMETQTKDGRLIYKFLSESVNEAKSSKSKEAWWNEGNKETGYLIIKGRKITAELPYKTIEFKTKEEAERWFVSRGFVKESVNEAESKPEEKPKIGELKNAYTVDPAWWELWKANVGEKDGYEFQEDGMTKTYIVKKDKEVIFVYDIERNKVFTNQGPDVVTIPVTVDKEAVADAEKKGKELADETPEEEEADKKE